MHRPDLIVILAWVGAFAGPVVAAWAAVRLRRSGRAPIGWTVLALFVAVYGLGVWAVLIEPATLTVRRLTLDSPTWRGPPLRIGVISDTHVGSAHVDVRRMQSIVARMNQEAPDVVLLLGDYAGSHEPASERSAPDRSEVLRGVAAFAGLKPPQGVYAVLGNHDIWYGPDEIEAALTRARTHVLANAAMRVGRPDGAYWIAGLEDLRSSRAAPSIPAALAGVKASEPVILLMHEPDPWAQAPASVALSLAGHTHCGQVNLPFVGRLIAASPAARQWACGVYREGGRTLFVSGGVGTSILPVRFRAPPEIDVVTLRASAPLRP